MVKQVNVRTSGAGMHSITREIESIVGSSNLDQGLCTIFLQHTSASLLIQENADPSAKRDLETWMNRLVKRDDPLYTHTAEGPDDMPSHIKTMLTASCLSVPVVSGRLGLGTWQGIYLWEHRDVGHRRSILVHLA